MFKCTRIFHTCKTINLHFQLNKKKSKLHFGIHLEPKINLSLMHPFESDHELSKNLIALLFKLSKEDNGLASIERKYIYYVAQELKLNSSIVEELENSYASYKLEIPTNEFQRMTILYYLLFLIKVDAEVSEKEIKMVKEFGFKLGFRSRLVDELTTLMKEYEGEKVPPSVMLEKIKKYQN